MPNASENWAYFPLDTGRNRSNNYQVDPTRRYEYATLDQVSGVIRVHTAEEVGRVMPVGTIIDTSDGSYLVHGEEAARPETECPDFPMYCWTWSLYAQRLPDGPVIKISQADRPGPQFYLPRPISAGSQIIWAQPKGKRFDKFDLVGWSPHAGARIIAADLPAGTGQQKLSYDQGNVWVGVWFRSYRSRLFKIVLGTGKTTEYRVPIGAAEITVADGYRAYVLRYDKDDAPPLPVRLEPADGTGKTKTLGHYVDVYDLTHLGNGTLSVAAQDDTIDYHAKVIGRGRGTLIPAADTAIGYDNRLVCLALDLNHSGQQTVVTFAAR